MLKGKNLLWLVLGGGAIYWYWMKMKKDQAVKSAAATTPGTSNFYGFTGPVYKEDVKGF
jgi:hypothetical protein